MASTYSEIDTKSLTNTVAVVGPVGPAHSFDLSISGAFVGTLALQRYIGNGADGAWRTVKSYTGPVEDSPSLHVRKGLARLKFSAFTSGTAVVTLQATDAAMVPAPNNQVSVNGGQNAFGRLLVVGQQLIAPVPLVGGLAFMQTTYPVATVVGGLIQIPMGLPGGTPGTWAVRAKIATASIGTPQTLLAMFFRDNPSNTTFADDGSTQFSIAAADRAIAYNPSNVAASGGAAGAGGGGLTQWVATSPARCPLDANGTLNLVFLSSASNLVFLAPGTLLVEGDGVV